MTMRTMLNVKKTMTKMSDAGKPLLKTLGALDVIPFDVLWLSGSHMLK